MKIVVPTKQTNDWKHTEKQNDSDAWSEAIATGISRNLFTNEKKTKETKIKEKNNAWQIVSQLERARNGKNSSIVDQTHFAWKKI